MKKKILVLVCGGTIVMVENQEGVLTPSDKESALKALILLEPKLSEIVDFDLMYVSNIDSSDVTPIIWDQLAAIIYDNYEGYDGFVVTHGTDTMAYSASALSFALQNLGKPIVFTGAQIPGHYIESDAKRNFINAIRVASSDVAGVMIVFGDQILQGVRATKISHAKLNAFESVNAPSLGEIRMQICWRDGIHKRQNLTPALLPGFEADIAVFSLVPGMPVSVLEHMLSNSINGLVLIAFGTGNIPREYLPFLQKAKERNLPVIIRSQCLDGSTKMAVYETGRKALQLQVIDAFDMSLESCITKLMWALKRGVGYEEIKTVLHKNLAGEINKDITFY